MNSEDCEQPPRLRRLLASRKIALKGSVRKGKEIVRVLQILRIQSFMMQLMHVQLDQERQKEGGVEEGGEFSEDCGPENNVVPYPDHHGENNCVSSIKLAVWHRG
ncbi:hypothetical protein TWF481_007682 [Arthrobotrys musiformis]|uniref:Uncharacterized protein n=1 Tax=Arthrobotrys musiformis TaxID=47236 RepID=A0AAV9WE50_9PEZI